MAKQKEQFVKVGKVWRRVEIPREPEPEPEPKPAVKKTVKKGGN